MREQHLKARERRDFFSNRFEDKAKNYRYSDYLKTENPADENIVAYEVSYQLSYVSSKNELRMNTPITFIVYAVMNPETDNQIYDRTKNMILDMQGKQSGDKFNPSTRKFLNENDKYLNIEIAPRGLEKLERDDFSQRNSYEKLSHSNIFVEEIDKNVELENKSGRGGFHMTTTTNHFDGSY